MDGFLLVWCQKNNVVFVFVGINDCEKIFCCYDTRTLSLVDALLMQVDKSLELYFEYCKRYWARCES